MWQSPAPRRARAGGEDPKTPPAASPCQGLVAPLCPVGMRAPTSLWGRPAAEKMGIFCPRAMLFITSMGEMPVWIISSG